MLQAVENGNIKRSNRELRQPASTLLGKVENGAIKRNKKTGGARIFYDGYWIRHYEVPQDTLLYKKQLIDQLTKRVFHHVEPGINTPGERLEEVRAAYETEENSSKKRVLAAMLAGALLNRGSDILTKMVELEAIDVEVNTENPLVKECGRCFMGALEYGKYIKPIHGREGLDELWGEPFKVFATPMEHFLESRYIKLAHTMREIDSIADKIESIFGRAQMFKGNVPILLELADSSKKVMETMRSDQNFIGIWPCFVSSSEGVAASKPLLPPSPNRRDHTLGKRGIRLFHEAGALIVDLSNLRIPMPVTTQALLDRCDYFQNKYATRLQEPFHETKPQETSA
ncbi:MAG: hypothetical protein ACR2P9_00250 [Gammaproteobacteria bacterium]